MTSPCQEIGRMGPMSNSILGRYCPNCDHTYFSRARHDFRACPCWISSNRKTGGYVDGGRAYLRVGGQGITVRITIEQSDRDLADDYRKQFDKYGLLKGKFGEELVEKEETDSEEEGLEIISVDEETEEESG